MLFSCVSNAHANLLVMQSSQEDCVTSPKIIWIIIFIFRPPPNYWLHKHVLIKSVILFEVIGAASKGKLDVVTSMGASATIDYNKESIKDKVYTFVLLITVF